MEVWVLVVVIHLKLFGLWDTTTTVPVGEYRTLTECMRAAATSAENHEGSGANRPNVYAAFCERQLEA